VLGIKNLASFCLTRMDRGEIRILKAGEDFFINLFLKNAITDALRISQFKEAEQGVLEMWRDISEGNFLRGTKKTWMGIFVPETVKTLLINLRTVVTKENIPIETANLTFSLYSHMFSALIAILHKDGCKEKATT
jgi:hypothetical protein